MLSSAGMFSSASAVISGSASGTVVSGLLLELVVIVSSVISASRVWKEVSESDSSAASSLDSSSFGNFSTLSRFNFTILLVEVIVGGGRLGVISPGAVIATSCGSFWLVFIGL